MIKNLLKSAQGKKELYVLDGLGADNIFEDDRCYYKEWLLGKLLFNRRSGLNLEGYVGIKTVWGKILDYFKSTRTRFFDYYKTGRSGIPVPKEYTEEMIKAYYLYDRALKINRPEFLSALFLFLDYPICEAERIMPVANALNIKFVLPFYDLGIIKSAFSISAAHKVGYKDGKKIIRKLLKEAGIDFHASQGFGTEQIWNKFAQGGRKDFIQFYSRKWRSMLDKRR